MFPGAGGNAGVRSSLLSKGGLGAVSAEPPDGWWLRSRGHGVPAWLRTRTALLSSRNGNPPRNPWHMAPITGQLTTDQEGSPGTPDSGEKVFPI